MGNKKTQRAKKQAKKIREQSCPCESGASYEDCCLVTNVHNPTIKQSSESNAHLAFLFIFEYSELFAGLGYDFPDMNTIYDNFSEFFLNTQQANSLSIQHIHKLKRDEGWQINGNTLTIQDNFDEQLKHLVKTHFIYAKMCVDSLISIYAAAGLPIGFLFTPDSKKKSAIKQRAKLVEKLSEDAVQKLEGFINEHLEGWLQEAIHKRNTIEHGSYSIKSIAYGFNKHGKPVPLFPKIHDMPILNFFEHLPIVVLELTGNMIDYLANHMCSEEQCNILGPNSEYVIFVKTINKGEFGFSMKKYRPDTIFKLGIRDTKSGKVITPSISGNHKKKMINPNRMKAED